MICLGVFAVYGTIFHPKVGLEMISTFAEGAAKTTFSVYRCFIEIK
ncbi:hypothetical protein EHE19_011715 [Ruminiclostridium herbifermentans]|uniref:Uncharacterized protein n=1 Tax=Ruminiclostridium herbifermentans TaxID=2488810 RepID=A0A7H1VJN0_9FIRM|nr:hypothetical protein EHE19_011715 [Ruminiclostridium herbifermentans]